MFTAEYKLASWVFKVIAFLVVAMGFLAVQPQQAEAFIFRAIGRGILGAGRLIGRGLFGAGRLAFGAVRGVGRLAVGAVRGAGRLVIGTGRFLAGGPFFARRGAF